MDSKLPPKRNHHNMKRSSSSSADSHHSPLRFHSPLHSDAGDPPETDTPPYASPSASPEKPPSDNSRAIVPHLSPHNAAAKPSDLVVNRAVGPTAPEASTTKVGGGGAVTKIRTRSRMEETVKKAALFFRLTELVLCLISFSVMAADKTQGWSGDSFDRYKEYRYCLSVNVIAFVYSGFQAFDLAYHLISKKHVIRHHIRLLLDFFMDQVLAYLLISASSAAATRVDDWQSNWGKDEFTEMASASIAMAFLAFIAFAISATISGHNLCGYADAS